MHKLFKFEPADDPQVEDDQYVLISNPNITIQVCRLGATSYIVNEHGQDDPADTGTFWMRTHGEFGKLTRAMLCATKIEKKVAA